MGSLYHSFFQEYSDVGDLCADSSADFNAPMQCRVGNILVWLKFWDATSMWQKYKMLFIPSQGRAKGCMAYEES